MRKLVAGLATTAALALVASTPSPAAAGGSGHHKSLGDKSLAAVLTSDGNQFDRNWHDYDIVTEAVLAVLASKPNSPVGILTDGSAPVTAFIPTDRAFQRLVRSLTGSTPHTEKKTFSAVAGLGIDTVETVLLYHVVPGATITYKQALKADGAKLKTAQGGTVKVDVRHWLVVQAGAAAGPRSQRPRPARGRSRHQQGQQADRPRHRPGAATPRPLI